MKEEFNKYLISLGLTSVLIDRIAQFYAIHEMLLKEKNEEIEDIFVSEYIDSEGIRNYIDLWFFSKSYFLISNNFVEIESFILSYSLKTIRNLSIKKKDYDFAKADDKSRLEVLYAKTFATSGHAPPLKASKENSDQLKKIYIKWFLSNLL